MAARRRADWAFLVIALSLVTAFGLAQIAWGERLSPGRGLGWDGRFYARMAQDFPRVVFEEGLDAYRLQRVVTPGVVYLGMRAFGLPRDDAHVVDAFAVYNLLLLLATVVVWRGIVRAAGLGEGALWLGFLLLFANFANLKMPYYYPVLTDTTAVFLGALLVYFHLRDSTAGMLGVMAVGAFSWPSFLVLGGLLFLFPRTSLGPPQAPRRPWHLVAGGAAAAFLVVHLLLTAGDVLPPRPDSVRPPSLDRLVYSVPLSMAYIVVVAASLLGHADLLRLRTYRVPAFRLAAWLALLLASRLVVGTLARGRGPLDFQGFLWQVTHQSIIEPGLVVVAAAVYLGLVALIALVCWRRFCRAAHHLGVGMTLFVCAILAQSLTTEPRQVVHGLAALVLVTVSAVEGVRWPAWGRWLLVALALFGSKVWFGINHEGFAGKDKTWSYPAQYYFMNLGPWMERETFRVQGLLAVAAGLLVLVVMRRGRPLAPDEAEAPLIPPAALRRGVAATVALGLAGALTVGVEVGARIALARRPRGSGDGSRSDARLGWTNTPGGRVDVGPDGSRVEVVFNARGLRGPDRPYEKTSPRVLLLGDGFVEGYTVAEQATARARLERRLREGGCPSEVLNGGVAGYSTDQAYLFYTSEAHRYRPDVVVLFFYSNDLYHSVRGRPGKPHFDLQGEHLVPRPASLPGQASLERVRSGELDTTARHLFRGSAALRLLSNTTLERSPALHRLLGRAGLVEWGPPPPELWPYGLRPENRDMWRVMAALLRELRSAVDARGGRLVLLYVPARFEVDDAAWKELRRRYRMGDRFWQRERVARRLGAVTAELAIPLVDPRDELRRARSSGRDPYFHDGLWTAEGQAVAADALREALTTLLPCRVGPSVGETAARH
jgi:hypothetical protein